jgi:hypothetical protein
MPSDEPEVVDESGSFLPDDPDPTEPAPSSGHIFSNEESPAPDFSTTGPEMGAPPDLGAVPR